MTDHLELYLPLLYNFHLRGTFEHWFDHHTVQVVLCVCAGNVYLDDVHQKVAIGLLVYDVPVVEVQGIQQGVWLGKHSYT